MADYTNSKDGLGRLSPENAVAVQFEDLEPLLTPEQLINLHLKGLNLRSAVRNPFTGKYDVWTNDDLKEYIINAVALAEAESNLEIFPVQHKEKLPFDRCEYKSFGYIPLRHRPVSSLQSLRVVTSSEQAVYALPLEWVDVGYLSQGYVYILPLTIAVKEGVIQPLLAGPGGSAFLALFGSNPYVPAFWEAEYTTGFKDGLIPKLVNQYIGVIAAMEVLSAIAATYARTTSSSLGIDSLSQSSSGPGAQLFAPRLEDLASKRKWLMTRLKAKFGMSIISSNF